jgi:hypothetical protein
MACNPTLRGRRVAATDLRFRPTHCGVVTMKRLLATLLVAAVGAAISPAAVSGWKLPDAAGTRAQPAR